LQHLNARSTSGRRLSHPHDPLPPHRHQRPAPPRVRQCHSAPTRAPDRFHRCGRDRHGGGDGLSQPWHLCQERDCGRVGGAGGGVGLFATLTVANVADRSQPPPSPNTPTRIRPLRPARSSAACRRETGGGASLWRWGQSCATLGKGARSTGCACRCQGRRCL
jgi:hypothetical protein